MAASRCPRESCDGKKFELARIEPNKSDFAYDAVQCVKCGAVVSVTETHNLVQLIGQIFDKLGIGKKF